MCDKLPYDELYKIRLQLLKEVDNLRTENKKLREYVSHKEECNVNKTVINKLK